MDNTPVTHNEAKGQFEIALENQTAFLSYRRSNDHISLVHTEVPEALRGKGLGAQLVHAALDYARFNQLKIVPVCPFVKAYLQKHPEEQLP